jgi:hypothetical protein
MANERYREVLKGIAAETAAGAKAPPDPATAEWGTLDPAEWAGRATLMEHSGFGKRWIPNGECKKKFHRGWTFVGGEPEFMVEAPAPAPVVEPVAAPTPKPKKKYKRKTKGTKGRTG